MIEVSHISKKFGNFKALNDVSFSIKQGDVVAFLGPNGAGKTTTMRIITGYLAPTEGVCRVGGFDMATHALEGKQLIGYLPESAALYLEMELIEFLKYAGRLRGLNGSKLSERIEYVVNACLLKKVVGQKLSTLSKGYKQRVGMAQALLHEPSVLILDEPTVGLDPNQLVEFRELIKNLGKTSCVLLSTHILQEVPLICNRVLILCEGRLVLDDAPSNLLGTGKSMEEIFREATK